MTKKVESFFDPEAQKVGGMLVFTSVPNAIYKDPKVKEEGKLWKVSVVVDRDTFKAWKKTFPKNVKQNMPETDEFEEIFKVEPPFDGDEQYIIELKLAEKLANGEERPEKYRPKIYLQKEDGRVKDATNMFVYDPQSDDNKGVGNGSLGVVSYTTYEDKERGVTYPRLRNVLVTDLEIYNYPPSSAKNEFGEVVEVVGQEQENDGSEFETPVVESKAEVKPKAKTSGRKVAEDDDEPF